MSIGVDGEVTAVVDRQVQQLARRIKALRPAVDLHRRVELRTGGEDVVGVERRRVALADHPSGAMSEDVDVRRGDGAHHPLGHRLALHAQLGVHAGDHHIELRQHLVGVVEGAVFEDVDFDAGEDAERRHLLVEDSHVGELLLEALLAESMSNGESRRVIGEDHVLMTQRSSSSRHRLDAGPAVAPQAVQVAVAAQRCPIARAIVGEIDTGLRFDLVDVARVALQGLGDQSRRGVTDPVELGERRVGRPLRKLVWWCRPHDL